ncbi:MAG: BamA/TamA family outer membrane protein [Verrucomicrobiales bacterium]
MTRRPAPHRRRLPLAAAWAALAVAQAALTGSAAEVRFEGLSTVGEDEARAMIEDQLAIIDELGVSTARADDAAFFLERAIVRLGLPDAAVDWELPGGEALVLRVDEGPQLTIGSIEFDGKGADLFPEEDLRALLIHETAARRGEKAQGIPFLPGGRPAADDGLPYIEADLEVGIERLRNLYLNQGYLDASVTYAEYRPGPGGSVEFTVIIDAGVAYSVGAVETEGFTGGIAPELQKKFDALVGSPLTGKNVEAARAAAEQHLKAEGKFAAEVVAWVPSEITPDQPAVPVTLRASERLIYTVREIRFEGGEDVSRRFLENTFKPMVGEPYDPKKEREIEERLIRSGIFQSIRVEHETPDADPGTLDLAVHLVTGKPKTAGLYGGYGTYDGAILGASFQNANLFHMGRRLEARIEGTQRGYHGDAKFSDPWLFDSKVEAQARAFAGSKEHEGYTKFEVGGRAEFIRSFGQHLKAALYGEVSYVTITDAAIDESLLGDQDYFVHLAGLSATYSTVETPSSPVDGIILHTAAEIASASLGSDAEFARLTARASYYKPIGEHLHLALGARAGMIRPSGESEDSLPIDLRFFSGGPNTVRSFRERQMLPQDKAGHPLGGEFYATFNAELTFPLYGGLKGAVFTDAGNLLPDAGDASLDEMHYAGGLGIRYDLPVGPLRVDYGWNLNRGEREPSGAFHVSFGFAF